MKGPAFAASVLPRQVCMAFRWLAHAPLLLCHAETKCLVAGRDGGQAALHWAVIVECHRLLYVQLCTMMMYSALVWLVGWSWSWLGGFLWPLRQPPCLFCVHYVCGVSQRATARCQRTSCPMLISPLVT